MSRDKRSGPVTTRAASTTNISEAERTAPVPAESMPTARTYALPPCRGRRLWLAVVLSCPRCGTGHSHRVFEAARLPAGRTVKTCPVTGKPYALAPVQRRREARRAA